MCFFKTKTVLLSVFFVLASFANDEFSTPHSKEKFLKICSEAKNFDDFLGVFPSLKKEKEEIESTAFFDSHYSAASWLIKHGITAQQCPIWISFFEQSVFDDPNIKKQFIERCKTAKTIEDFIKTFPSLKKVKEQFLDTAPSYLVLNYARSWLEDFVVKSEKCPIWEKLFIPKTIKLNTASKNAQYEISWHPKSENISSFRKFHLKR